MLRNLGGYYKKRLTVSQNVRGALGILVKCDLLAIFWVNEWFVACLFLVGFGQDSEGGVLCSKITMEHQVNISGTKLNFSVRLTMM